MPNIKKFTDDEIRTINVGRKIPCINSSGECYIVSVYFIHDNGRHIEVTDKLDVNVFATAAEAYKWVAKMVMRFDESCIPTKRAYIVRFHAMN
jgi:hypothetical protein